MGKGIQYKNKCEFSKKDFAEFREKYESKIWPTLHHYPFSAYQAIGHGDGGYEE
jgi:hypothetical protein